MASIFERWNSSLFRSSMVMNDSTGDPLPPVSTPCITVGIVRLGRDCAWLPCTRLGDRPKLDGRDISGFLAKPVEATEEGSKSQRSGYRYDFCLSLALMGKDGLDTKSQYTVNRS